MSFVCLPSFVFTLQIEFSKCCVWFQCFAQWHYSCVSNFIDCWKCCKQKSELLMDVFCVPSFCSYGQDWVWRVSCLISMFHSVMMLLFFQYCLLLKWREMKRVVCGRMSFVFLLSFVLHLRLSSVSVVFDFNDSLNDVAPMSPISLSVYRKNMREKNTSCHRNHWCIMYYVHHECQVQWVLC